MHPFLGKILGKLFFGIGIDPSHRSFLTRRADRDRIGIPINTARIVMRCGLAHVRIKLKLYKKNDKQYF